MHKPQGYDEFQDEIFQEIGTLESKRNRAVIEDLMDAYGLTWDDVEALYREGMNGKELGNAMWEARKKTPPPPPSTQV